MKTRHPISILLIALIAIFSASAAKEYSPLPQELDGSMMPYDFAAQSPENFLPDSLSPVYASYIARHGARYLTGPKKTDPLIERLEQEAAKGNLSFHGQDFLSEMQTIYNTNRDNWGELSQVGVEEQIKLAKRLHNVLPELGEKDAHVYAIASKVPRVVMTMYNFCGELVRCNDGISTLTDEGHRFSPLVRCFSTDKAYADYRKNGDWQDVYDDFVKRVVPTSPAVRLFKKPSFSDKELREITLQMYEVLKGNRAYGLAAPTTEWMSEEEYRQCWRSSNLQHYLRNSITPLSDLAAKATSPLLENIIAKTDSALATVTDSPAGMASPTLNCWFGHAETLLPLISLMRLPSCLDMPLDYDRLDDCWRIQELTPLGANILILIAKGPSGREYACVQLNGRTVSPLRGGPEIVEWRELRDYWLKQIEAYNHTGN